MVNGLPANRPLYDDQMAEGAAVLIERVAWVLGDSPAMTELRATMLQLIFFAQNAVILDVSRLDQQINTTRSQLHEARDLSDEDRESRGLPSVEVLEAVHLALQAARQATAGAVKP